MSSKIKRIALNDGLKAGLTINQINEVLTKMYAYVGFPRSLNGITTFMTVLQEREQIGIKDPQGEPVMPLPATSDKYEIGKNNLYQLLKLNLLKNSPAVPLLLLVSMLEAHINMGLNTGLTEIQLKQLIPLINTYVAKQQADITTSKAFDDAL